MNKSLYLQVKSLDNYPYGKNLVILLNYNYTHNVS